MGCDMMRGYDLGSVAADDVRHLKRNIVEPLVKRVAELEEAFCGFCQMLDSDLGAPAMHPQLREWFDKHKQHPGCNYGSRLKGAFGECGARVMNSEAFISQLGKVTQVGFETDSLKLSLGFSSLADGFAVYTAINDLLAQQGNRKALGSVCQKPPDGEQ